MTFIIINPYLIYIYIYICSKEVSGWITDTKSIKKTPFYYMFITFI